MRCAHSAIRRDPRDRPTKAFTCTPDALEPQIGPIAYSYASLGYVRVNYSAINKAAMVATARAVADADGCAPAESSPASVVVTPPAAVVVVTAAFVVAALWTVTAVGLSVAVTPSVVTSVIATDDGSAAIAACAAAMLRRHAPASCVSPSQSQIIN